MALLITTENRPVFLPGKQANLLWLVHTGERKGNVKVRAKVKQIAKWYLNRDTAPQSYRDTHPPAYEKPIHRAPPQMSLPYKD